MPARDAEHTTDRLIGRNIRFHRLRNEFSQSKLAARIGISFQQLQKYEKGANRICVSRLLRIAHALGVPFSALFDGIDTTGQHPHEQPASPLSLTTGQAAQLTKAFSRLTDATLRRRIVDLVQAIASARVP